MKYVTNLFKWAQEVYEEFCCDSYRVEEIHDYETGITIVYDLRTGKTAFSKCKKDEEFSEEIGVAVAYTRLKGCEVPKVLSGTPLKNLTTGEKFILYSLEDIFCVVGINPLNPTETILINTRNNNLCHIQTDTKVYKII